MPNSRRVTSDFQFVKLTGQQVRQFVRDHEHKGLILERTLDCTWMTASLASHVIHEPVSVMGYQQLHHYLREGVLLTIRGRCEIGMALARLACELGRDLFRIIEEPSRADLWLKGKETDHKLFKATFRFDNSDTYEKELLNLYNLTSTFGVHSHKAILEGAGKFSHGDIEYVRLKPPQDVVNSTLFLICSVGQLFVIRVLTLIPILVEKAPVELRSFAASLRDDVCGLDLRELNPDMAFGRETGVTH